MEYEILINEAHLLKDIQTAFNNSYPFLKIEFMRIDTAAKTLKPIYMDLFTPVKKLQINEPGKINIGSTRTVIEVTNELENLLGIMVEVYRRSGNVWNVISLTEGWTLERQNEAGKFISSEMTGVSG